MRKPETIELWAKLTGKSIFWWEPVYPDNQVFVVCDTQGTEHLVRQNGSDIQTQALARKGSRDR